MQAQARRTVLTESDPNWINVSDDLYFLKDGKRFLWSSERSGYRHLYLFDFERKQLTQLTKGEWEVTSLDGVDEAKGLVYFTATEKSLLERHLYRVALDGTAFTSITKEAGTHAAIFSPNASAFYDTYSNTAAPQRQDLYRADGSRIAAINENRVAELADYHFSPMEFLTVQSHDGVALNASIIKPRDFSPQKKYPVLVYTYGGPHAQVVRNGWAAPISCGTSSWRKRATLFFRLIIAARRGAAMPLKRRCISAWARKSFPINATACVISSRFRTSMRIASGFGDGATAAI